MACDSINDYWRARVEKLSNEIASLRVELDETSEELNTLKNSHIVPRLSFENLQAMDDSDFKSGHTSRSTSPAIRRVPSEVQMGPVDAPVTSE